MVEECVLEFDTADKSTPFVGVGATGPLVYRQEPVVDVVCGRA